MLRPTQSNIVVDPTVLIENRDEFGRALIWASNIFYIMVIITQG